MGNARKAERIVLACMLAVGIISAVIIWRNFRPSPGRPYEQITWEQAKSFMTYEQEYTLVDISPEEQFRENHLKQAVNIPYDLLGTQAALDLPEKEAQVYVYGRDETQSEMAALKLSEMGYTNISEIVDALEYLNQGVGVSE